MKALLLEGGKRPSRQIREELGTKGITITPVEDIPACISALEADRDQLVIIDLDLFRKGIEALPKIREISPEIVIVVMASLERLAVVDEALQEGAWDFVIKQPDLSHLQEIPQVIAKSAEKKKLRAEAEHYLEEAKWLMTGLQECRDGVFIADQQDKIVFTNPALCTGLGYKPDELIGKPVNIIAPSLEGKKSSWKESPQPFPHKQWEGKTELKKKDGSDLSISGKMTRILDKGGEAKALIGICFFQSQQDSETVREDVLTRITEDLKAPVAAMIGYLEIVSTIGPHQAEPNQLMSIQRVHVLARRLFDIVSNHTGALEIDSGKFEVQKGKLEIAQILELAVSDRKGEANVKNIDIVLETGDKLPPLFVDAVQIERAVGILLSNAINLSPLGGSVILSTKLNGKEVALSVKDSGAGFSKEEVPLLFKRQKLRRRGADIDSVGLYLAHHIITAHGGRIEVQTDPREGSTLTIKLPIQS